MSARRIRSILCPVLLGLLVPATASAAGFTVARFGAEHGHPTTDNATAIYFNPAALTNSDGTHLYLDGSVAWRSSTYTRDSSDTVEPAGAEGANSGEATMFNLLAGPMFGVTTRFDDLALGFGFYVPFGGRTSWDGNDRFEGNTQFPGAEDGVARWWVIQGELISAYVTAAAAYEFGDSGFSAGLNLSVIRSNVSTVRARTVQGDDDIANEGRSLLDVSGFQYGLGVGVQYEAIKDELWLGLSYTSQPNPFAGGEMRLEGTLKNKFGANPESADDAALIQELPDIVRIGGKYRPAEDLELRLHGDYQRWSVFQSQCVVRADVDACPLNAQGEAAPGTVLQNQVRNWDDTWGVRAGVGYWTSESTELFGGVGYASNAVPDETQEPSLPDFDSFTVAVGGRFGLTDTIHLGASYTHFFWLSRDIDNSGLAALTPPNNVPNANGSYSQSLGAFNANLDVEF
jgi:long-chain fatty acid transport protein